MENGVNVINRNKRGMMVVIGSFLLLMGCGFGFYGAATMGISAMAERLGATTAQVTVFYTWELGGIVISGFLCTKLIAKLNLHYTALLGCLSGGIGLILMAIAQSLTLVYIGGFLCGLLIVMGGPAMLQTAISKWYFTGRATLIGFVGLAEAVGTTTMAFIFARLSGSSANGPQIALFIGAAFIIVVGGLASLLLIRGCPEDYGWKPIGADKLVNKEKSNEGKSDEEDVMGVPYEKVIKSPLLWMFVIGCALSQCGYHFVQPYLASYSTSILGFTSLQAAAIVAAWSWGKSGSKIFFGLAADKFGIQKPLIVMEGLGLLAIVAFIFSTNYFVLLVAAVCLGFIGATGGSGTLTLSRMFGQRSLLKITMLPHSFNGIGGMIAPLLTVLLYDGTREGFYRSFVVGAVFIAAVVTLWFISTQRKNMFEEKNLRTNTVTQQKVG